MNIICSLNKILVLPLSRNDASIKEWFPFLYSFIFWLCLLNLHSPRGDATVVVIIAFICRRNKSINFFLSNLFFVVIKVSTNEYFWDFNKIIKNTSSQHLKNRNAIRVLMSEFVNHTFSFLRSQHVQPYVSLLNLQRVAHLRHSRVANPLDKGSFFPPLN